MYAQIGRLTLKKKCRFGFKQARTIAFSELCCEIQIELKNQCEQQVAFCIHPNLMYMVRMHTISSSSSASALRSLVLNQTSSLCMFSPLAFMSDLHGVAVINMTK